MSQRAERVSLNSARYAFQSRIEAVAESFPDPLDAKGSIPAASARACIERTGLLEYQNRKAQPINSFQHERTATRLSRICNGFRSATYQRQKGDHGRPSKANIDIFLTCMLLGTTQVFPCPYRFRKHIAQTKPPIVSPNKIKREASHKMHSSPRHFGRCANRIRCRIPPAQQRFLAT